MRASRRRGPPQADVDPLHREARLLDHGLPKIRAPEDPDVRPLRCPRGTGRAPDAHPQTGLVRRAPGPQIPSVTCTVTDQHHPGRRTGRGPFRGLVVPAPPAPALLVVRLTLLGIRLETEVGVEMEPPEGAAAFGEGDPTGAAMPRLPEPPPPMSTRPSVFFKPLGSRNVVSWMAGIRRCGRQRSTLASRCPSRIGSIVTLGFDNRRQAAFGSAPPGKSTGRLSPGRSFHARPMVTRRSRMRTSLWRLRPYSLIAPSVWSSPTSGAARPRIRSGSRHRTVRPSGTRGFIRTVRRTPGPAAPGGRPEAVSAPRSPPACPVARACPETPKNRIECVRTQY